MVSRLGDGGNVDVRALLAARTRHLIGAHLPHSSHPSCPWRLRLAALEAGDPVEVHGWEVPREVGRNPNARYVLQSDGTVVEVRRPSLIAPHVAPYGPAAGYSGGTTRL